MKIFLVIVVIFCFSKEATSKPFLFSTSKWLFGRFFSSNSSVDHSTQNIEDLSEEGPFFHHNEHANRTTANMTVNAEVSDGSQVTDLTKARKSNLDAPVTPRIFEQDEKNESSTGTPGILQRKISKILNKLQLYSAVRSTIHNVRKQQNGGDTNNTSEEEKKQKNILTPNTEKGYLPPENTEKGDDLNAIDKMDENNEQGDDFDENIDEPFVFDDESGSNRKDNDDNRLSLETGNIGIHIMEIFGSIVTIFLSAAYQVGMYANSLQGSGSGATTTQPIEGAASTIKWKLN